MDWNFKTLTNLFSDAEKRRLLLSGTWGLEMESQRVTPSGDLALSSHDAIFGNKLENPSITTDFSESQLELITPPFESIEETYGYLEKLRAEVESKLYDELLWPLSMPPRLPSEDMIPIARFDNTPEGMEKEVYRKGLALRYGKKMQMISGLHYNFSFSDEMINYLYQKLGPSKDKQTFTNELYFAAARNYLRYRWLLIYLFGASPSADPSYYSVIDQELERIMKCCPECCSVLKQYEQYATSLRVSRFGYSSTDQHRAHVSYNSLDEYIRDLRKLLTAKSKRFENLGIYHQGHQVQLNDHILQKESEFYSSIRFKQIPAKGETQLEALEKRGVKYLEVRILDLNPFERVGISREQMYFLHVFMLFCLFHESPPLSASELKKINNNHHLVALSGRNPKLALYPYGQAPKGLKDWGIRIFEKLWDIALLMDQGTTGTKYRVCLAKEYEKLLAPALLPSALIHHEMKERNESFLEFGIRRAVMNQHLESLVN